MERDVEIQFRQFLETVRKMAEESAGEAERHLEQNEDSLEFPFHDGQTGSLELALDYLEEVAKDKTPVSGNKIQETYLSLLLSWKRMRGSVTALERIINAMQTTFGLPTPEDIEAGEQRLEVHGK
jgi:hypothetical protein